MHRPNRFAKRQWRAVLREELAAVAEHVDVAQSSSASSTGSEAVALSSEMSLSEDSRACIGRELRERGQ
jgi:hypothetical protein